MWRHELDMVSSLASESAIAALMDMEKIISSDAGVRDPLFHTGLTYSSDMLRVAGFVAPMTLTRDIVRTFSQPVLGENEVRALRRALLVLISYLRDAITSGARPTLFLYEEALLLSDISGHLPSSCGSFFAPYAFWDVEDNLGRTVSEAGFSQAREAYQRALLGYLRNRDGSGLSEFAHMFEQAAIKSENSCNYSVFRLPAAFLTVVASQDAFLNQDEMQLFSLLDAFFFKQTTVARCPDPVLISRLLHVIGKATVDVPLVLETQEYFKLDGLLSGLRVCSQESIRA